MGEGWVVVLAEQNKSQSELNGIDAGIRSCKPGVRNMHVANFRADVVLAAPEVEAKGAAGGEIDAGGAFWDFGVGEESAAAKLGIGNDAAVCVQRPLKGEGIYADAVGGVCFLNDKKDGDGIDRVFQAPAEEAGAVRSSENQAVTQADIPYAIAGRASIEPVSPAGADLQFLSALDRRSL